MKLNNIFIIISAFCLMACNGNKSNQDKLNINSVLEGADGSGLEISAESMTSIIESIPSPLEVAMVIKESGNDFNEGLLNPQDNSRLYTTDQEKAMNIGIYGGDIGYINMFGKAYLTVNYLTSIKKLADAIKIGQFFDFSTIKRLASNSDKMDSLIFLTTMNFNKMDEFLRNQKRTNLSILMVVGTWTEGLYIATQVAQKSDNKEITEWIGCQKMIVDQLLLGLSAYKNDDYFRKLISDMNNLKEQYNKVEIIYEYHEPESQEIDGRLVIVDKSTSTVKITPEQIIQIGKIVDQMRLRLISNL